MPPLSTGRNGEPTLSDADMAVEVEAAPRRRRRVRRAVSRISIQSKLLVMLLVTSILSAAVVGFIGYQSGRSSLRASVFDRLTEIRASQSRQLEAQFAELRNSLVIYTRGSTATEAIEAFTPAFDQLDNATINPAQWQSIVDYYNTQFEKSEELQTGDRLDVDALLPTSNAQKYLQAHYTAPFNDWDKAIQNDDARDGSAWSAANARFKDFFREIVLRFEFADALLLDTRGHVVYSAYKGVDLGTNILTGPYREGELREAYQKARDWIETPSARGRVVEVNWRATHIDTGSGLQIMPNSVLAAASFTNFSRPPGAHSLTVTTLFSLDDPPDDVCAMLNWVAAALPQLRPDSVPSSVPAGGLQYKTSIPLRTPADDFSAKSTFLRWVWYASRRAGLHLDKAEDEFATPERLEESVRIIAPTLRLNQAEQQELLPRARLTRYGTDEYIQFAGEVPKRMTFVVNGRVRLVVAGDDGSIVPVRVLEEGDFLGQTALTREPVTASAYALEEVTVLQVEREYIEQLVERKPLLLKDIGRAIEERRANVRRALAPAAE
jgi:Cyclic nucleotide-binding domain/Mechanosensitive ion channel